MAGTKSSATVQQRQPLASSTMFSSGQDSIPQVRRMSPSTPTSPNSLMIKARRRPCAPSSRWRIRVVLPAPRNPVTTVTGTLPNWLIGTSPRGRGGTRATTPLLDGVGAEFPRHEAIRGRGVEPGRRRHDRSRTIGRQVAVDVGPLAARGKTHRTGTPADAEALDRDDQDPRPRSEFGQQGVVEAQACPPFGRGCRFPFGPDRSRRRRPRSRRDGSR